MTIKHLCMAPLGLCSLLSLRAQQSTTAFQLRHDSATVAHLQNGVKQRFRTDVAALSGTNKKEIEAVYQKRLEAIEESFANKEVLTDARAQAYLNGLAAVIFKANPKLDTTGLRLLFSRSWVPNAASMGEGTIFFHIGLFTQLANESQVAFVLCHELAHYYLNHSGRKIDRYIQTVYGDAFQKDLRRLQKTEYGRNAQLEKMVKNLQFSSGRHSREFETGADSMAVELMRATAFDTQEALAALAVLDSSDNVFKKTLPLHALLGSQTYAFKPHWIADEDFGFASKKISSKDEDSLKTHPDCSQRIKTLQDKATGYRQATDKPFVQSVDEFKWLQQAFAEEQVRAAIENKQLSRGLYLSLAHLQAHPQSPVAAALVGDCLNQMYQHQKDHSLGKYVGQPHAMNGEGYNQVLRLIQNLRLNEMAALSYHTLNRLLVYGKGNAYFDAVWKQSQTNFSTP